MLLSGGFTTILAVVAMIGTSALAAQQFGFTALAIAFLPAFGFATAATALVGQSIGAGDREAAWTATRIALTWSLIWMTIGGCLYFALARVVMNAFTDDPEVIKHGVAALRALSIQLPLWGMWSVTGGALRGSGDTRTPMITSSLLVWAAVSLGYVAVRWLDGGLGSVWLMFAVTLPFVGLANWVVLRRRLRTLPGSFPSPIAR